MPVSRRRKPKKTSRTSASGRADSGSVSMIMGIPAPAMQAIFTPPSIHGDFPEQLSNQLKNLSPDRKMMLLAFPPKCGGTFIRQALVQYLSATLVRLTHSLGGSDAGTYLPNLISAHFGQLAHDTVIAHSHAIGYHSELQLLNLFDVRPVVMLRDIADMLCSFSDMIDKEGREDDGRFNNSLLCGVFSGEDFLELSLEARRDFLINHQAPWYFQFYASWAMAEQHSENFLSWVRCEEFSQDPAETIRKILEFYDFEIDESAFSKTLDDIETQKPELRFNRGLQGRGREFFDARHFAHLHELAKAYPKIDFVKMGVLEALGD